MTNEQIASAIGYDLKEEHDEKEKQKIIELFQVIDGVFAQPRYNPRDRKFNSVVAPIVQAMSMTKRWQRNGGRVSRDSLAHGIFQLWDARGFGSQGAVIWAYNVIDESVRDHQVNSEEIDEWQPGVEPGEGWVTYLHALPAGINQAKQFSSTQAATHQWPAPIQQPIPKSSEEWPCSADVKQLTGLNDYQLTRAIDAGKLAVDKRGKGQKFDPVILAKYLIENPPKEATAKKTVPQSVSTKKQKAHSCTSCGEIVMIMPGTRQKCTKCHSYSFELV